MICLFMNLHNILKVSFNFKPVLDTAKEMAVFSK